MTRLRVRVGRWLAREVGGVDRGDLDEANELFNIAVQRLGDWADGDVDPEDFTVGYDVGTVVAFISAGIKLSARSVLNDVVSRLRDDPDTDALASIRLLDLIHLYFDDDHRELPDVSGE